MKKIFLILLLGMNFSFAEINEYMSDVYFANGIDTSIGQATRAKDKLKDKFELSQPDAYTPIQKISAIKIQ